MRSRRRLLACAVLTALALMVRVPLAQEHAGPHWTYGGSEGPEHWGELEKGFATCQVGQQQSPIDIHGSKAADVPPIQFAYQAVPLHIVNNGHTIQVSYAPGSSITVGDTRYELKQVHFHHPSEEKINGKGSAMVAHLVHASAAGKLAVVAVLLGPGSANPFIARVWEHLPPHAGKEQTYEDVKIDVADLLPGDRGYYTFTGSLTTPPCSEGVTWFVLKTPASISEAQADAFGKIYPLNARPVQPLNGREILASR